MHKFFAVSAPLIAVLIALAPSSLPIGGSPESTAMMQEELADLREHEGILKSHFESLQKEEDRNIRERNAVERALEIVSFKSQDAIGRRVEAFQLHREALQKRLERLEGVGRDIREARASLTALSQDRKRLEAMIAAEFRELADSPRPRTEERYVRVMPGEYTLSWPVYPSEGISAGFKDVGYRKRFKFDHYAVDIPAEQGEFIRAPEDGIVTRVNDMGYGYNTLKMVHDGDLETVYGHVSAFLVEEGEEVRKGQVIAKVGGRPGTKGAGFYTTGSHLHFETRVKGQAVDPTFFLPPIEVAIREAY